MKYEIKKGSEKDFEGAPEWALPKTDCYYFEGLDEGLRWAFFSSVSGIIIQEGSWLGCEDGIFNQHRRGIIAERRPITEPVWDGEGLPPVGVECEGLFPRHPGNSFEWQDCLVLYVFEHECAVKSKVTSTLHYCDQFRPIRSPEDVARDEEIVLLTDVICGKMPDVGMATAAMFAGRVYDAGYRRPEPHADEVQECEHNSTRPTSGGCICNDCGWTSW